MNPTQLRRSLDALGWSTRELARRLKAHPTTISRWCQGITAVPHPVAAWLHDLCAAHRAHRPPKAW